AETLNVKVKSAKLQYSLQLAFYKKAVGKPQLALGKQRLAGRYSYRHSGRGLAPRLTGCQRQMSGTGSGTRPVNSGNILIMHAGRTG
ncbi:MAG: hypothetical protein V5A59_13340, partial [Bacteroidales bacterium]